MGHSKTRKLFKRGGANNNNQNNNNNGNNNNNNTSSTNSNNSAVEEERVDYLDGLASGEREWFWGVFYDAGPEIVNEALTYKFPFYYYQQEFYTTHYEAHLLAMLGALNFVQMPENIRHVSEEDALPQVEFFLEYGANPRTSVIEEKTRTSIWISDEIHNLKETHALTFFCAQDYEECARKIIKNIQLEWGGWTEEDTEMYTDELSYILTKYDIHNGTALLNKWRIIFARAESEDINNINNNNNNNNTNNNNNNANLETRPVPPNAENAITMEPIENGNILVNVNKEYYGNKGRLGEHSHFYKKSTWKEYVKKNAEHQQQLQQEFAHTITPLRSPLTRKNVTNVQPYRAVKQLNANEHNLSKINTTLFTEGGAKRTRKNRKIRRSRR